MADNVEISANGDDPAGRVRTLLDGTDSDGLTRIDLTLVWEDEDEDQDDAATETVEHQEDGHPSPPIGEATPSEPHGNETSGPDLDESDREKGTVRAGTNQHLILSHLHREPDQQSSGIYGDVEEYVSSVNAVSKSLSDLYRRKAVEREAETGEGGGRSYRYRVSEHGERILADIGIHPDVPEPVVDGP